MAISIKDCACSSCGDDIKTGAKVTVITHKNKPTEIICFRCHPEQRVVKVEVPNSGIIHRNNHNRFQKNKPRFFERRK